MGVGDNGRLAEDVTQNEVGRLAAHAGQAQKISHVVGHLAAKVGQQHLGAGFEVARLGAEQAAGLDAVLNVLHRRFGKAFQRRKTDKQVFGHDIDARVGALGRQAGGKQKFIIVGVLQRAGGVRIGLPQQVHGRFGAGLFLSSVETSRFFSIIARAGRETQDAFAGIAAARCG